MRARCRFSRQHASGPRLPDLIDAMLLAMENIEVLAGQAFNIGGGPDNAVSPLETVNHLRRLSGVEPHIQYGPQRKGDQPYYVSDIRRFTGMTGWMPRTPVERGIPMIYQWIAENMHPRAGVLQSKEWT